MTKENFNKRIILWKLVRHYWSDNSKFIGLRRFTFCRNISIWLFLASSTFLFLHRNDQKLCKIYFNWIRNLTKDIYSKIRYVQFKGFFATSITCALLACFNFHNVQFFCTQVELLASFWHLYFLWQYVTSWQCQPILKFVYIGKLGCLSH